MLSFAPAVGDRVREVARVREAEPDAHLQWENLAYLLVWDVMICPGGKKGVSRGRRSCSGRLRTSRTDISPQGVRSQTAPQICLSIQHLHYPERTLRSNGLEVLDWTDRGGEKLGAEGERRKFCVRINGAYAPSTHRTVQCCAALVERRDSSRGMKMSLL